MISNNHAACFVKSKSSKISVKENGKQAIFLNPDRAIYFVIHVDNCVVKQALACDYVVTKSGVGDVLIELKGMDVDHAVEQVFATAELWAQNNFGEGKIGGLIICTRRPSFDTKIQRFRAKFTAKFKAPLHVWTRNDEFVFEKVLDFNGPK